MKPQYLLLLSAILTATAVSCGQRSPGEPERGRLESRSADTTKPLAEADALAIARLAVATNNAKYPVWLGTNVVYRARREGQRWHVTAEIVHYTESGEPFFEVGGHRFIEIDDHGAVIHYVRGR